MRDVVGMIILALPQIYGLIVALIWLFGVFVVSFLITDNIGVTKSGSFSIVAFVLSPISYIVLFLFEMDDWYMIPQMLLVYSIIQFFMALLFLSSFRMSRD